MLFFVVEDLVLGDLAAEVEGLFVLGAEESIIILHVAKAVNFDVDGIIRIPIISILLIFRSRIQSSISF